MLKVLQLYTHLCFIILFYTSLKASSFCRYHPTLFYDLLCNSVMNVVWHWQDTFSLDNGRHQHLPVLLPTDTLPFPFISTPIHLLSVLQRELANADRALRPSGSRDTDKTTCSDSFLEQKGKLRLINKRGQHEALRQQREFTVGTMPQLTKIKCVCYILHWQEVTL